MARYVATIDTKWEDFTSRHKEIREEVEAKIKKFLDGERLNPVAIRGPIGQGKTQLLYHIFRFVWENGGVAFYTTLDRLLPPVETTASDFAAHIDSLVQQSIDNLNSGELANMPFLTEDMAGFVRDFAENTKGYSKVILLIDEMERSYEKLLSKVKTDDRSPFGYWLEHTLNFPIAAFAPLSHYEALYGQAEKRRWDSITLPPITASTLREKMGDTGNFAWWISRGRLGISYKAIDSIKRKTFSEYKDFKDLVDELGSIAEVPAMDLHVLAKLTKAQNFVVNIFPQEQATLVGVLPGDIFDKAIVTETIKNSLIEQGWEERSVEFFMYYFNMVVEAISRDSEFLLPLDKYDELLPIFKLSMDLAIEHETLENEDAKKIAEYLPKLEENFAPFFFTRIFPKLRECGKRRGSILSYKYVSSLFPMPITSPVFGGIEDVTKAREILLTKMSNTYVASDLEPIPKGDLTFLYFPNQGKLEAFLDSEEIKNYLPPHKGLVCILLCGDMKTLKFSGIAGWLKDVKRLEVDVPSKILCDFLTNFCAWALENNIAKGHLTNLRNLLRTQAENMSLSDKESSRKIFHYESMLRTFLKSFAVPLDREQYSAKVAKDTTARYAARYTRFPDVAAVSFIKNKEELSLIYRFKKLLLDSEELKRLRSGIGGLLEDASVTMRGDLSTALENISIDYESDLHLLQALAHLKEIEEDEFVALSEQREAKEILKSIFRLARNKVPPSRLEDIKRDVKEALTKIQELEQRRQKTGKIVGVDIRQSSSEKNQSQIKELLKIMNDAEVLPSDYVKWLLCEFTAQILSDFKEQYLHPDLGTLTKWEIKSDIANGFQIRKKELDRVGPEVFEWIEKSKEGVALALENGYKAALTALTRYEQQVDFGNIEGLEWSAFSDAVGKLTSEIRALQELNSEFSEILKTVNELNTKLKAM